MSNNTKPTNSLVTQIDLKHLYASKKFPFSIPILKNITDKLYTYQKNRPMLKLVYKPQDINPQYYQKVKHLQELEHQIGRLINFKRIISKCSTLPGSFIEFGCWKGFSLLWIAYFMERNAIFNKPLFGIDGFTGLPYSEGGFTKKHFTDTSIKLCHRNIFKNPALYPETKKNIFILKSHYQQKQKIINFIKNHQTKKLCFIHIDCDVSPSANEIFDILISGKLIANQAYLVFDDYGWSASFRKTINQFIKKIKKKWTITPFSKTKFTKSFYLVKK